MTTAQLPHPAETTLHLRDAEATTRFGRMLAQILGPGDTILLSGPIGAGKSHLARTIIREMMARAGEAAEDIPSPTYTLVQSYPCGASEIWHADLYRLTDPAEVFELGLDEAFSHAICLVEWPDRLGSAAPADALSIALAEAGDGREARLSARARRWSDQLGTISTDLESGDVTFR